ncbi:MAG: glucose-6-phosphate isomerase [Balneolaceae bacterium]|nr:MAG: glucose-6-phosphate isomerase [Balneolaceae bacterium]
MITIDRTSASGFITDDEYSIAVNKADTAFDMVVNGTGKGSEWLGWRRILAHPNDAELDEIAGYAAGIRSKADIFVVCGIGGSYTGAMAIIRALNPVFKQNGPEIIFAGHHMSGKYLKELVDYLEEPREDGSKKSVYLNVISKSGTTLETALAFRTLRNWMHLFYDDAEKRISATTGPEGGVLNKIIDAEGYKKYVIPDDVGGRFSVLTPVGLLPIAVAGIDIQTLFYGAVAEFNKSEEDRGNIVDYAATRYALLNKGFAVDVIGSFEPELLGFIAWIQQLIGESEGKEGKGLYPAAAGYSTDLHSVGQLIQEGERNIIETLIVVDQPFSDASVAGGDESDTDQLNYLSGKLFHDINRSALNGTVEAHTDGGVPVIKIIMQKLNAQQLGRLIYFYELFTAVYVYMLGVNPFNQPGVEDYKKAMYRLLGKN